jgi:hypothetical protein
MRLTARRAVPIILFQADCMTHLSSRTNQTPASLRLAGALMALLGLAGYAPASAQPPAGDTVAWTVSTSADAAKPGGRVTVTVHGAVQDGWHVYGLKQLPEGPTPMSVAIDPGNVAKAAGAPTASAPQKILDPGFGVETPFYAHDFTVAVPVRLAPHLAAGKQLIPVSVRFQTCNGQICKPPKTVSLSAPITIQGG